MTRGIVDTAQEASTPPAGKYKDVEARLEEHTSKLNTLLQPYTQGDLNGCTEIGYEIDFVDAAGGNYDFVIPDKIAIRNVRVLNTGVNGANANSVQLKTAGGAAAITDAMSTNGKVAGDVVSMANLQNREIAAGATVRVVTVRAGGALAFTLLITAIPRA